MNEHRKDERKKVMAFTPAYDSHQNLLGYLGDLSLLGAMLVGEKPVEVNQQITLVIEFPETSEFPARKMILPVRVAWCKREKNSEYFNTGVEFQELKQQDQIIIKAILERYQFRREMPA